MRSLDALKAEPRMLIPAALKLDPAHNHVDGLLDLMNYASQRLVQDLVIEVGSHRGVSTEAIRQFALEVIAVDPWAELSDCRAKREFDARFQNDVRVSYLRLPSLQAAKLLDSHIASLVYLDAMHDETSVFLDIQAWMPKVKPGGFLAGHDYSEAVEDGGVIKAVNRVFGKPPMVFSDTSWLVQL